MCPERQIWSAFCDGEVPSPWKERLEAHLAECPVCRGVYEVYCGIRRNVRAAAVPVDAENAAKRVASNLRLLRRKKIPVLKRRVSLALTAIVASAAFVFGGGVSLTIASRSSVFQDAVFASVPPAKPLDITVNVKDIRQLLDILNNQQGIREITIELPETQKFEFRGEPVFLREAEYSRGRVR